MTEPTTDPGKKTLTGMVRSIAAMTPAELEAKGLPPARAEQKSASTAAGWFTALLGVAIVFAAAYVAFLIVQGDRDISVMVVVLVAVLGFFGLAVFGVGMNLVSRDASPAIGAAGEIVVKIIRALRGGGAA